MIHRYLMESLLISLRFFPVTLIQGPRQVGKSFILNLLKKKGLLKSIVSLDDIIFLTNAVNHPHDFIEQLDKPVGIDEIQRAPQLLLAIKKYVDEHKSPGDFILTGSGNIFSYPETLDSLAGRMDVQTLSAFSLGELLGSKGQVNILQEILSSDAFDISSLKERITTDLDIWQSVFWGAYPDIVLIKDLNFRDRWYRSYITTYIERDLRDLAKDMTLFHYFFRYTALLTSQQAVLNNYCADLKIDARTAQRYLDILTMTYQVKKLEPFFTNHIKKIVKSPKIYLQDSGLASWFFELSDQKMLSQSPHKGALLETLLFNELKKLCDEDSHMNLSYFRTTDGHEIDFVVTKNSRHLLIECKSQLPSTKESFSSIEFFRKTYPDSLALIFYPGSEIKYLKPGIWGVPFSILALRSEKS